MDRRTDVAAAGRFDAQADGFDQRAGVRPEAAADIATAVLDRGLSPVAGEVVLEVGAGTGEVGQHLCVMAGSYIGIDRSGPMLAVFRSRLAVSTSGPHRTLLAQADGDRHWPVRNGSVTIVFASRVAHLLVSAHVVREAGRVCRPGGRFVIGRIERTGVKQVLRRQREAILADRGAGGDRSGGRRTRGILEALVAGGGVAEPTRTVATWPVTVTPEQVIAGWETMPTMGGATIDLDARTEALSELRAWARGQFGDLDRPQSSTEHFTLEGVRLGSG